MSKHGVTEGVVEELGPPPKVVWVRMGNCTTAELTSNLRQRAGDLLGFDADADAALLVLARALPPA